MFKLPMFCKQLEFLTGELGPIVQNHFVQSTESCKANMELGDHLHHTGHCQLVNFREGGTGQLLNARSEVS